MHLCVLEQRYKLDFQQTLREASLRYSEAQDLVWVWASAYMALWGKHPSATQLTQSLVAALDLAE